MTQLTKRDIDTVLDMLAAGHREREYRHALADVGMALEYLLQLRPMLEDEALDALEFTGKEVERPGSTG